MAYVTKEEAKTARTIANKIAKKYRFKISVTKDDGQLNVAVMSGSAITLQDIECNRILKRFIDKYGLTINKEKDFIDKYKEFLDGPYYLVIEHYWEYLHIKEIIQDAKGTSISILKHTSKIGEMLEQIEKSIKKALNWFDESDPMTDYFNTAFYYNVTIGKWNKKYTVMGGIKC